MSNWITITEAHLNAVKMAPLLNALRTAALADGQTDPVVATVATVVDRLRRKIAACPTNRVDADEATIPKSLLSLACRMVVREAKDRLEIELSETERKAWDVDERELNDIATCKLPVELPDEAVDAPVQVVQPGPSISGRRRHFSRRQQDGA